MKTLQIKIQGKEDHDLIEALQEIIRGIEQGYRSGNISFGNSEYNFTINGN